MNGSTTATETDGSVTAGNLLIEVAQYALINLELSHEIKGNGGLKTNVLCAIGEKSASFNVETAITVIDRHSQR